MILHGKTVKKGQVEGEVIVSRLPFSYLGDLNVEKGTVAPVGHDLEGQSIAGKIFVFPTGKGSTVGPYVANMAKKLGNTPAGMICVDVEPVMAMVAIMNDIPMVHRLDQNPLEVLKTGDYIKMNATKGVVEIINK
jgi:predicted aconitase with swiveling domain